MTDNLSEFSVESVDKFTPFVSNESVDYLLPEDQIDVVSGVRRSKSNVKSFQLKPVGPLYLTSCYDEFSRNFVTVNIARNASSTIPLVQSISGSVSPDELQNPSVNILQNYHPGYSEWISTFKKLPPNTSHLLSGTVLSDINLLFKLKKCHMFQKCFEPVYGSMCLYTLLGDELVRVSESFHFDATTESVRKQYIGAYHTNANEFDTELSKSFNFSGTSVNVGDGSGSNTHMNMFNATLPAELKDKDLFVVVHLSKILSTDADKALAPYYLRGSLPDIEKHKDSCRRLIKYRQPLAVGISKINDCLQPGKFDVKISMYAQKLCYSEAEIAKTIKEMFPAEGVAPYCRLDSLDIETNLTVHFLGRHDLVDEAMLDQGLGVPIATMDKSVTSAAATASIKFADTNLIPRIYPSQIQSSASPLSYNLDGGHLAQLGKNSAKLVVRQLMPLLPANAFKDSIRQFKAAVDNTIFVYPIQFEKFQNRNLCLRVELVELKATTTLTTKTILTAQYEALSSIYNHFSISGPLFVKEAFSRVSYHVKNPVLTDEFKIRLPDIVTGKHWLRFTVLHVHVKPTTARGSILPGMFGRSSVEKPDVECIELGLGMIPLMINGGECLTEDKEHIIYITMPNAEPSGEVPFIRVRTRAISSLVSSDSRLQAALRHHPLPLGHLPSSIMSLSTASAIIKHYSAFAPSEARLVTVTQELSKSSTVELSRHFLVIMRQLLRILTAGPGVVDENYSNPYKHTKARSQAFLTILQVIGKICGDGGTSPNDMSLEKEFLNAYVEFLLDEEVPVDLSSSLSRDESGNSGKLLEEVPRNASGDFTAIAPVDNSPRTYGRKLSTPSLPTTFSGDGEIPLTARTEVNDSADNGTVSTNEVDIVLNSDERESIASRTSAENATSLTLESNSEENAISTVDAADHSNDSKVAKTSKFISRTAGRTSPVVRRSSHSSANGNTNDSSDRKNSLDHLAWVSEVADEDVTKTDGSIRSSAGIAQLAEEALEVDRTVLNASQMSGVSKESATTPEKDGGSNASEVDSPAQIGDYLEDGEGYECLEEDLDGDDEEFVARVRNSADRKSWGKYITDSMWTSGQLQSLAVVLGSTNSNELGEMCLDDIANHIVLQAERIILERLLGVASMAMVSQVKYNSESLEGRKEALHSVDSRLVMSTKKTKFLSNRFDVMPFDNEKLWFAPLDDGYMENENKLSLVSAQQDCATSLVRKDDTLDTIYIQPIQPRYDTIDGYRDRNLDKEKSSSLSAAAGNHWWPWLYEVIVYQWGAVLAIILSSSGLISSNNIESLVGSYPFDSTFFQKMEGQRDTRSLLMEHGPLLLKIMFKSLSMRIKREHKRSPIVLDDQFLNALENLVMLLAVEAVSFKTGLWRCQRLISSLANFLRSLFSLIVPNQVVRLLGTYFRAVRKGKADVDASELRLQMIEEISLFDHIVAINFPYALDAPLSLFTFSVMELASPVNMLSSVAFTACGFRNSVNLPPYCLSHMIVTEIMALYRQEEQKTKNAALAVLRDLMVRHSYDARFQSSDSQQRIACMYLPFMKELLEHVTQLSCLKYDSNDRKEILAMLLYILQNIPIKLLRHQIRLMCKYGNSAVDNSTNDFNIAVPKQFSSELSIASSTVMGTSVASSGSRVISMRHRPMSIHTHMSTMSNTFVQPGSLQELPVHSLLQMLHLILDTFEVPKGLVASPRSFNTSDHIQVLSPAIGREDPAVTPAGTSTVNNRKSAVEFGAVSSRSGVSLLANLDQRMQTRKTTINGRKSAGAKLNSSEDRKWVEHTKKMTVNEPAKEKVSLNRAALEQASIKMSSSATDIVIQVLSVMLEECPRCILHPSQAMQSFTFLLRDANIDESVASGVKDLRIVEFIKMVLTLSLHGLFCNQDDISIANFFKSSTYVIQQFGAKIFLLSVEDTLQDWMRVCFFHAASQQSSSVRESACNFVLFLLFSCQQYLGSFTLVATTTLAVFTDVLTRVLDTNRAMIVTHSDEDRILLALSSSVSTMKAIADSRYLVARSIIEGSGPSRKIAVDNAPFYYSVFKLMQDLEVLLLANSDVRRYVSHHVGYDFQGANMLDGPFDNRASVLTTQMRQQRKSVRPDNTDQNSSKSGFQIEEVMLHFVQAAEVFDPIKLPRFRMQWLENLARLHEMRGNRAEGSEVRWRIYCLCKDVEDTWQNQWVPRPPLDWLRRGEYNEVPNDGLNSTGTLPPSEREPATDRRFYDVLIKAADRPPARAWSDYAQYITHMNTTLAVATDRFCLTNLIHLAERSSTHLIQLYRLSKQTDMMMTEYNRISTAIKAMTDKGITSAMALGTFYRVCYDGMGVPDFLRGKEFIFRNANHLHVSEFQTLVLNHLKSIVVDGVEVKAVQDVSALAQKTDMDRAAYMVMNSVKLVLNKTLNVNLTKNNTAKRPVSLNKHSRLNKSMESMDQVHMFQYTVPFTKDPTKAHAKTIDQQWTRVTTLTVNEPFPYILTRQLVSKREIRDYCPIEVATNDIEERIEAMEVELGRVSKNASDNNNLMRIVQGTVMPQVNAGAAEVARVFLSSHKLLSNSIQLQLEMEQASLAETNNEVQAEAAAVKAKLALALEEEHMSNAVYKLKVILVDFLICAKLLLAKTRRVLISDSVAAEVEKATTDASSATSQPSKSANGVLSTRRGSDNVLSAASQTPSSAINPVDLQNIIWQTEMEKGFETLVQSILPYVQDIREADQFLSAITLNSLPLAPAAISAK